MARRITLIAGLAAAAFGLSACTTMGTGQGVLRAPSGRERVALTWKSISGMSGTMTATLPDGVLYTGPFFQITSQVSRDVLTPLWTGWNGWYDWDDWGQGPMTEFITRYSGKVLANLRAANGEHMRCKFHLAKPALGMAGGGAGKCETTAGQTLDAYFPPA
ncbi:MAG: hypothetical protein M0015_06780 [Betaproteobacteria bacterium]|nr:hypothetical protein [Betaproteobacteria bacterium]